MGLNPPASVFFLLMGLALAGSLFAYARWFGRMKNIVWLLPVCVLLFYYRSFPNYMFFWLVPTIPDLARMKMNPFGLRRSMPSIPTIHLPVRVPRFLQGGIIPSMMLGLVRYNCLQPAIQLPKTSTSCIAREQERRVACMQQDHG